jgi:hypothetical protein
MNYECNQAGCPERHPSKDEYCGQLNTRLATSEAGKICRLKFADWSRRKKLLTYIDGGGMVWAAWQAAWEFSRQEYSPDNVEKGTLWYAHADDGRVFIIGATDKTDARERWINSQSKTDIDSYIGTDLRPLGSGSFRGVIAFNVMTNELLKTKL